MAHNINFANGKWSVVVKGEKPWHSLGEQVQEAMTAEQAIKLGGLDYVVEKRPLFVPGSDDDKLIEVPGYFSNVRKDTNEPLGVVKSKYRIIQNREAFVFFDSIIDKGEAVFETAGALGKGERIFVTAKLPEDMLVKGEKVEKYIILTNSHDGSSSIIAGFTNVRVLCQNTLLASLRNLDNKVSIAHTSSAEVRLSEAARLMGIASQYMNEVNLVFEDMTRKKVSNLDIDEFISNIFLTKKVKEDLEKDPNTELSTRMKNIIEDVKEFTLDHPTQNTEAAYRTLWGLYNGVSGYFTHVKEYKSAEQKMYDMNYNGAADKISKAFDLAVGML